MTDLLAPTYGSLLLVRPPPPVTFNRAGKNYKSEVAHLEYSPRRAYDEWLAICDAICGCGGDAVFELEDDDLPYLDRGDLAIDGEGAIRAAGSPEILGRADRIATGRVFTANGPWCAISGRELVAVMPNMLDHRRRELPYFVSLLGELATAAGLGLRPVDNPHRWEGMADVAVIGDRVVLTHTSAGRYSPGPDQKTLRSTRAGGELAADALGIPPSARIRADLVYPCFHGDTVHFAARRRDRPPVLVQYPDGLWPGDAEAIAAALGPDSIVAIDRADAVDGYAANSRQVGDGLLVPDRASAAFLARVKALGLTPHRLALDELFAKAGGGPACATLYLPADLALPADHPARYSNRRQEAHRRRDRIPARLTVAPDYFAGRPRG